MSDLVDLTPLALRNLDALGGGDLGEQIKRNLELAVADVRDHGKDGKTRKVSIHVTLTQRANGKYIVRAWVDHKLPGLDSIRTVTVAVEKTAGDPILFFNQESPLNPEQMTFDSILTQEDAGAK